MLMSRALVALLADGLRIEAAFDARPRAGDGLQRRRVHDLVRRLPDLCVLTDECRLVGRVQGGLPEDHRLVHAAPVEICADRALLRIDEAVDIFVGCRPVEVAARIGDVTVNRRDRRVDELGQSARVYCRTTAAAPFLKTYFWIFPVAVFGSSCTNVTPCGALKWASRSRGKAISSASVAVAPGFSTTYANGASPHFSCVRPTIAASCTAGWRSRTPSTSRLEMFSPPLMITSLIRSRIST